MIPALARLVALIRTAPLVAAWLALFAANAGADDVGKLLDEARSLEAESASLLLDHFRFEGDLVAQRSDSLAVFLGMPYGAPVILKEVLLYLDGELVATHRYSVDQLMTLRSQGAQLLHLTRIPPGPHMIRAEAKVMQGRVFQMEHYQFSKGKRAKFLLLQFAGATIREFDVAEW